MNIRIVCTGTSPLLMHNPRMVDPEFDLNREIKVLTSKRKKTDEDIRMIERLEWFGGLYTATIDGEVVVTQPSSKLRKCIINAGKIFRLGAALERSLTLKDLNVPLIYDGPKDINEIFKDKKYHSRLSVVIGGKRVMRIRPEFFPWALEARGLFVEDAGVNYDDLVRIVEMAGTVGGIGDNRVNGYGKFEAKIEQEG